MQEVKDNYQELVDKFEPLYQGLRELEKKVLSKSPLPYVLKPLAIAGSRIDIAFSSQKETDFMLAKRDLERAKEYYKLRNRGKIAEPHNIIIGMAEDLFRDHPTHYLLRRYGYITQ